MTDIEDITWSAMTRAGIDIGNVHRVPSDLGGEEYILIEGDTKVAFGPAVDMENGGTIGYDVCVYEHDGDDWQEIAQHWTESVGDLLRLVDYVAWAESEGSSR